MLLNKILLQDCEDNQWMVVPTGWTTEIHVWKKQLLRNKAKIICKGNAPLRTKNF